MISNAIALPYEVARLPLAVVDRRLLRRLPEASPVRVTVGRTIGSVDRIAGAVLRNRDIAARGDERIDRIDALVEAERLGDRAASRREAAQDVAATGRQEAAEKRQAANERAESGFDEAERVEEQGKRDAAEKAKKAATAKKKASDRKAADRTETVKKRKEAVEGRAEAKKKATRDKTSAQLADARESEDAAAGARDDAAVLGDLTEAKKTARKKS